MHLSDGLIDLYRNPIDLVLRYGLSQDSNLIGRKLCDNARVLVASPDSLARHGQPDRIEELARRNGIRFYRNGEPFNRWRLFHQGHGIAYKSRLDVVTDVEAGRLVDIFPDARGEPSPLYVAYPSRRYQPARIKVLMGYLEGCLGEGGQ